MRINFNVALFLMLIATFQPLFGQNDSHIKWENEIIRYEQLDSTSMPLSGGILLVGSSSFTMWKDVHTYFPGKNIINRGFGGSQMSDVLYYKERLILPYLPKQLIIYEGENDIFLGKNPEEIFTQFIQLVNWGQEKLPGIRFTFISLKPSPSRWNLREKMIEMNHKLKLLAHDNDDIDFVNIWEALLNQGSGPITDYYLDDLLHLNKEGYKIWAKEMLPFLI